MNSQARAKIKASPCRPNNQAAIHGWRHHGTSKCQAEKTKQLVHAKDM